MAPIEPSSVTVFPPGVPLSAGYEAHRTVVRLRGEHDIATVATLSDALARVIAVDDNDLVIDLSEVEFMDASTLGVVLRARGLLRRRSRSLTLRSPSVPARRILDLCGLADLVDSPPVEAPSATGPGGALGTWVAVPATDPIDRSLATAAPKPDRATTLADHGGP